METWEDWRKAWVDRLDWDSNTETRHPGVAKPYKLDRKYKFITIPAFATDVPISAIGKVVDATERELVIEKRRPDGSNYTVVVSRSVILAAVEVEVPK